MSYVLIPGVGMVALATTAQLLPGAVLIETAAAAAAGDGPLYPVNLFVGSLISGMR